MLRPNNRVEMYRALGVTDSICAEIGVFDGGNAKDILTLEPQKLYLIDTWRNNPQHCVSWSNPINEDFEVIFDKIVSDFAQFENVQIVRADSCEAANRFGDLFFDFIYIDTTHERLLCHNELVAWFDKVKPGGWLCGHDYTSKFPGVVEAVSEFLRDQGLTLSALTLEDGFPSFGIRKPY